MYYITGLNKLNGNTWELKEANFKNVWWDFIRKNKRLGIKAFESEKWVWVITGSTKRKDKKIWEA